MTLLLLLSALLSALTGSVDRVGRFAAPLAVSHGVADTEATARPTAVAAKRPAMPLLTRRLPEPRRVWLSVADVATAPLYASRRRE